MGCNQGRESALASASPRCCVPFVDPKDFKNEGIKRNLQHMESGRPSLDIGSNMKRIDELYDFAGSKPVGDLGGWSCTALKRGPPGVKTPRAVTYVTRAEVENDNLVRWRDHATQMKALKSHPNVSKLYETFEDFRFVYFVTDLCAGQLLLDGMLMQRQEESITEPLVAGLIKQVLEACRHLHSHRLCHRNLQPESFRFLQLLGKKGEAIGGASLKLVDCRLAIPFKDKTPITDSTPLASYILAPEVDQANPNYNEKVDVWACGVLAFILLSGNLPFGGGSEAEIYSRLRRAKEDPCSCEGPNWSMISQTAKAFVDAILRVDPGSRPSADSILSGNEWVRSKAAQPAGAQAGRATDAFEPKYFASLQRLNAELQVRKSLVNAMALYASDSHIKLLEASLNNQDCNEDSIITVSELKEGVVATKIQLPTYLTNMFLDKENDHSESMSVISFPAFIGAVQNLKRMEEERICWNGFRLYDRTDTGMCPKTDLQLAVATTTIERMMKGQYKELVKKLESKKETEKPNSGDMLVSFKTPNGATPSVTFVKVPLGLEFENNMPLTIKSVDAGSHAQELGVLAGWVVRSVDNKMINESDIESARELVMKKVFEIEGVPHGPPPGPEANMSFNDFLEMIRTAQRPQNPQNPSQALP